MLEIALEDYPIRLGFVRELHRILMNSVRGQDKAPGEFRREQNWIGRAGCTIEQATFVPPNPVQLPDYLADWEQYLDSDDIDFLIQTAVVHAQFELLHPFKDGNGRIGRILIPLFLYQKRTWNGWIAFFLKGVCRQAEQNSRRVQQIRALYEEMKLAIQEATHSQYSVHLLDAIFSKPIFRSSDLAQQLNRDYGVHEKTTPGLLRQLKASGILRELQARAGSRPAVLCFPRLIDLAEGRRIV